MAGWNYEKSSFKRIYAYNDDLLTDDVDNMNLVMGTDNRSITSQWKAYQFGGAFFRLNYAFDNRYLLEVNGRYDGSSRFPSDERWAFFPSASVVGESRKNLGGMLSPNISLTLRSGFLGALWAMRPD